jgi:cell division septation protein DedD
VNAQDSRQEALVRSLVPDAFRTVANGRGVMQVGVFSRRDRANEIVQMLDNKGVQAIVEE